MKIFKSIRWCLQLWYGVLLVAILCSFGFSAWQLLREAQLGQVDQQLRQLLQVVVNAVGREGYPGRPPPPGQYLKPFQTGLDKRATSDALHLSDRDASFFEGPPKDAFYYVAWLPDRRESFRSASAPPDVTCPEQGDASSEWRVRGTLREHFHNPPLGGFVLVGRDVQSTFADIRRFAWLLAGVGAGVLALGLVVGSWLFARALRPIRDISVAAAKIASGDLAQRISTVDSESELGQLAGVLNATFVRLDAAFTRQARFTADAAHELRTPISVMLTHTQNGLASECPDEEHRKAFAASHRAAQRMRRLTESLLALARLDSGDSTATRELCDVDRITCEAAELLRPLAQEYQVTLEIQSTPAHCEGNAEQLGQVVTNLVTNAIYYNRPGGRVRVTVTVEAGAPVLSVCDTGIGISSEDLPHIFERFYRADKMRSNADGHTGLGLAITQAIVKAHGGTIEVASESGRGSTFNVRLPAIPFYQREGV
jgi:signal transduction histidine kinase